MHLIILFNLLEKHNKIPEYTTSPTGSEKIKMGGTGFVDDCNLAVLSKNNSTNEKPFMKNLKNNTQAWERYLFAMGGNLELSKCFWILILWKWIGGQARLMTKIQVHLRLQQSKKKR